MNLKLAASVLFGIIAGIGCGGLVCHSIVCRDAIGRICGRGHLLALVDGQGIYEADVEGAAAELRSRGAEDDLDSAKISSSAKSHLSRLIGVTAAKCVAVREKVSASDVDRELRFLESHFRDRKTWVAALRANGFSERSFRKLLKEDLRARKWIDRQIASQLEVVDEERQRFYEQHTERFALPIRLRVSHLFLAAPPETAPEMVDFKKEKIALLAKRIKDGENFSDLVPVESEDEASKTRGGNLGYFSAYRMPPDFFAAAAKLPPGEMSAPVKTGLGFHIIQGTEIRPARQMTFAEVSQQIGAELEQAKRRVALGRVDVDLRTRGRVIERSFESKL